jgi:hypothetical protein
MSTSNLILETLKEQYKQYADTIDVAPHWSVIEKLLTPHLDKLKLFEEPRILWIKDDKLVICEGSKESPKAHRNKDYHASVEWCEKNGLELMNEDEYRRLQTLDEFDVESWSWLYAPEKVLKTGDALRGFRLGALVRVFQRGAYLHSQGGAFRGVLRLELGSKKTHPQWPYDCDPTYCSTCYEGITGPAILDKEKHLMWHPDCDKVVRPFTKPEKLAHDQAVYEEVNETVVKAKKLSVIMEWLYLSDGYYKSNTDWRIAFIKKLKEIL